MTLPPLISPSDLAMTPAQQIAAASARIRGYCRWHIYPSLSETVELDSEGGAVLLLRTTHVTEIPIVTVDGTPIDTALLSANWREGILRRRDDRRWLPPAALVTVTFTHGYDTVPPAIADVTNAVASRLPLQLAGAQQTQEAIDGASVTTVYGGLLSGQAAINAPLTALEEIELAPYRVQTRP